MANFTSSVPLIMARSRRQGARLLVAADIFQNDHAVVHQHAHTQCQSSQGHHVQADAGQIHKCKGRQDGNGYGGYHSESTAPVTQKYRAALTQARIPPSTAASWS